MKESWHQNSGMASFKRQEIGIAPFGIGWQAAWFFGWFDYLFNSHATSQSY